MDFEAANFGVLRKTHGKTSISKLQLVKIAGILTRNARSKAPAVSSGVSGLPPASPCRWGKLQNHSFSKVSGCHVLAWQAWHFMTVSHACKHVEARFA